MVPDENLPEVRRQRREHEDDEQGPTPEEAQQQRGLEQQRQLEWQRQTTPGGKPSEPSPTTPTKVS